jgi:predicted regulator of amino acid metabolism with ACT domain
MVLVHSITRRAVSILVSGVITGCLARVFSTISVTKLHMMDSGEMIGFGVLECSSTKTQKCSTDHTIINHGMMLMSIGSDTRETSSMTIKMERVSYS